MKESSKSSFLNSLARFWPFWLGILFFQLAGSIHYAFMPIIGETIFPIWVVGLLIGGAAFIQLIFDVPIGFALDRFGYIRLLRVGALVFMVASLILLFNLSQTVFLATLFFAALGWLVFGPGANAYVLSQAPKRFIGRFMGFQDICLSVGVLGAVSIFLFISEASFQIVGLVLVVFFLISFAFLLFAERDKVSVHAEVKIPSQHYYVKRHFITKTVKAIKKLNPASSMLALTSLTSAIFYSIVWFVVPLSVVELEGEGKIISIGLGIFDFAIVATGAFLGYLADRYNKEWLVFFSLLLFGVAAALLGFALSVWFLVLGFLAAVGDELTSVSLWAWMNHLDKSHAHDGLIAGVVGFSNDLGWTIGPILAGILYTVIGPSLTIAVGAFVILITWVVYVITSFGNPLLRIARLEHYPHKPHRHKFKR